MGINERLKGLLCTNVIDSGQLPKIRVVAHKPSVLERLLCVCVRIWTCVVVVIWTLCFVQISRSTSENSVLAVEYFLTVGIGAAKLPAVWVRDLGHLHASSLEMGTKPRNHFIWSVLRGTPEAVRLHPPPEIGCWQRCVGAGRCWVQTYPWLEFGALLGKKDPCGAWQPVGGPAHLGWVRNGTMWHLECCAACCVQSASWASCWSVI